MQTPQIPRGFLGRAPRCGQRMFGGWAVTWSADCVPPGPATGLGCRQDLISVASRPPGASGSIKMDCAVVE